MFWLLTVLLFSGPAVDDIHAGSKVFPTEQACNDYIAELRVSPPPDGVLAAAIKPCEAHSNPVTEKDAVTP